MGGDDPRREQQQGNVIIPDTGAGPYWYVDPRAGQSQQPNQALFEQQGPAVEQASMDQGALEAMSRLFSQHTGGAAPQDLTYRPETQTAYDPMEKERRDQWQSEVQRKVEHEMGPEDVMKTVTMDLGGNKQWEVPAVFDNMTDEDRNIIQYLPHTQWPKSILDKIKNAALDNLQQGNDPFGNSFALKRAGYYGF